MIRAYRSECGRRIGGRKLDVTCAALRAFEGHAIDYLLKPFDRDRFDAALDRARRLIEGGRQTDISHEILDLLRRERKSPARAARIAVTEGRRTQFVRPEEGYWIEAQGNCVQIHTATAAHLVREALASIEQRLDPERSCAFNAPPW